MATQSDVDDLMGMQLIGFTLATALYGITILQSCSYLQQYGQDRWIVKLTVASVFLVNTAGSISFATALYWYLIKNRGNSAVILVVHGGIFVEWLTCAVIVFIVQCFFANSVWSVNHKRWPIPAFIFLNAFGALVIPIAGVAKYSMEQTFATTVCDITITISLCLFLHRGKSGFLPTDSLMDKLIIYTLNRGIQIFIIQTLNLVLYVAIINKSISQPFHACLSKVYVITFMAILNRRTALRREWEPSMQYEEPMELVPRG